MIKIKCALFLLLITSFFSSFLICMNDDLSFTFDDIFVNEKEEEPTDDSFINSDEAKRAIELHQVDPLTACDVVTLITNPPIEAQIVLQEDLYLHTNPNNSRSLLNLPGFYHHYFYPCENYFWTQLFYNQTSNGYYTKESTQLKSYILLNNPNLIRRIEEFEIEVNVPDVLAIFSNMKLQERRLGLMFGIQHVWGCNWHVRAYAPWYYLERNLSLTDEEQILLERAGVPPQDDPMDFARKHVIIDKLGVGDTRIELGYMPYQTDYAFARIGGLFTIPTAFAWKQGLYGTHFSKTTPAPNFNLLNFINTILVDKDIPRAIEEGTEFLIAAVDRLSTIVLETGMGNEGHFGLGIFADQQLELSNCWTLRSKSSLEYITPRKEKRFYIMHKDPAEFDRDYTSTNPIVCQENLNFLNQQLIETLFPTMYETHISPGFIFIWNTSLTYHGKTFDFQFGYDLYWQDKEKLGTINATAAQIARLRKEIAIKPCAYQSKLFGDLIYKKQGTCRDYYIGFHLDATILSTGIGKDFTGALYFDMTI
ncbi:MAG: hypothetical protein AB7F19_04970 [Candidatus Babeliales bacterium]